MKKRECIAMVLAGGKGARLAALTKNIAKPAIPFGGQYRLIDFTLSNCYNSNIDIIGVLMPDKPFELIDRIGRDKSDAYKCQIYSLPPGTGNNGNSGVFAPYTGTADAIYRNIDFIEKFNPEYILVLSGDHIYKMDYRELIDYHKEKGADATIAVLQVPWEEASRFGIMTANDAGIIEKFTEKPPEPQSNLASMGVYVFAWEKLKHYLLLDEKDPESSHDFGKNIVPQMLQSGEKMYAYNFDGYWKDVGTVESLYKAHMDLLEQPGLLNLNELKWPIFPTRVEYQAQDEVILDSNRRALIGEGCSIHGHVEEAILFSGVHICPDATVRESVIMPGARIGPGSHVEKAIIGPGAVISAGCWVRGGDDGVLPLAIIGENNVLTPEQFIN